MVHLLCVTLILLSALVMIQHRNANSKSTDRDYSFDFSNQLSLLSLVKNVCSLKYCYPNAILKYS